MKNENLGLVRVCALQYNSPAIRQSFPQKECVSVTDRQAHDSRFLYPLHPDDPAGDSSACHVVLVEPEIPPNTGAIARLCGATDSVLHLVHPLGFKTDDRHLKRAGLDYWEHVRIRHWDNLAAFLAAQPKELRDRKSVV